MEEFSILCGKYTDLQLQHDQALEDLELQRKKAEEHKECTLIQVRHSAV